MSFHVHLFFLLPRQRVARGTRAVAVLAMCLAAPLASAAAPADFVLLGGRVNTFDARGTVASAVAIRDGIIIQVGDDAAARTLVGPATVVYDAAGQTVIPGLNETHVHPTKAARDECLLPFRQLGSIAEIRDWVRQRVAETPEGTWVVLPRIDVTRISERRMPERADLDEAAPHRPVVYVWRYANRQVQVLNSAALRVAGITRLTVVPPGGRIVVDAAGEPTGVIEDAPALTAEWLRAAPPPRETYLAMLEKLLHRYASLGITSITDRRTDVDGWEAFRELRARGSLPVRVTLTIDLAADGTAAGTERFIRSLPFGPRDGDDWVKLGPLKISIDGGVLYGTSYMRSPYGADSFSLYGVDDPEYRGRLQMTPEQVRETVRTAHRLGWPMCSHVTGDAGVDIVLDAVEAADQDSPIADRRFNLLHAYFPDPKTAARCKRLGVCVDTQPAWLRKDGDALAGALGGQRMAQFIGLNVWREGGVTVAINSDHFLGIDPVGSLNPYHPFLTIETAVTRRTESGRLFGPDQRVSREQALRMMTVEAARLHCDEDRKGTLEIGRLGDLAVLSADPLECPEAELSSIRAVLTVVDGRIVHREESP